MKNTITIKRLLFLCCLLFYGLQRIPKESVRWIVCAAFCGAAYWLSEARAPQLPWHTPV